MGHVKMHLNWVPPAMRLHLVGLVKDAIGLL